VREVTVKLGEMKEPRRYTVKLYFAEPENVASGKRIFHVDIEGKRVLNDFDIAKEAGGSLRSVVREFPGISARGSLAVRLSPANASSAAPVLCGLELIAEDR
jgi:hypothetical protein